jgi:cytoskeletal protein CcmA (bactofilin family)
MAYASVIGSSTVIRGNVRGDSSLQILGRVEGDVAVAGDLALGPDAAVVGALSGARITIAGSVEGDVTASDAVVIVETGKVIGDLTAPRIGMSEGALVRGSVKTDGVPRPARSSEARVAAAAPAERPAPRAVVSAVSAGNSSPAVNSSQARPVSKKAPPPPVIQAPRAGARARKRMLKR